MLLGAPAQAASERMADETVPPSAVVFAYFGFGDDADPSNGIGLDLFDQHIAELTGGNHAVLPLPRIADALRSDATLPDRAVAITIDDTGRATARLAVPRLVKAGLPFTLFVSPDLVESGGASYSWDELKTLAGQGASIGIRANARAAQGIAAARALAERRLGQAPTLLAWTGGEYTRDSLKAAEAAGFTAGFGSQSGVAARDQAQLALPRFTMTDTFGSLERFQTAADALPLWISDLVPDSTQVRQNPPTIGFTVDAGIARLERLACFAGGAGKARVARLDNRVEIRFDRPFDNSRIRLNCTLPGDDGRWRWFGLQLSIQP